MAETKKETKAKEIKITQEELQKLIADEVEKITGKRQSKRNVVSREEFEADWERMRERVKFFLPSIPGDPEGEVTVGWNGVMYKIKRGEEVEMPRGVYEILINSGKQVAELEKTKKELANVSME